MELKRLNLITSTDGQNISEKDIVLPEPNDGDYKHNSLWSNSRNCIACLRSSGDFANKSFSLSSSYDYALGLDDDGSQILVVLKKKDC